jgi:ATP phosphoribosyltransferase
MNASLQRQLKIGLPKGSLQEATFRLFGRAGYNLRVDERSYHPIIDDSEIWVLLIRPQEIPRYVGDGILDVGMAGYDWIVSSGQDLIEVADLPYSKRTRNPVRVVLAVPQDSPVKTVKDLEGLSISTEYVDLTRRWLKENGVEARVEFSWGACEMKVPDLADAIVVNTETGSSIRAHGLRIAEELLVSTTRLVANKEAWADPWKREKMTALTTLLQGALAAECLVGIKMNVQKKDLNTVIDLLPALKKPTISALTNEDWTAVEAVIDEHVVRDLIPRLLNHGAQGIIEFPLNKVIL